MTNFKLIVGAAIGITIAFIVGLMVVLGIIGVITIIGFGVWSVTEFGTIVGQQGNYSDFFLIGLFSLLTFFFFVFIGVITLDKVNYVD